MRLLPSSLLLLLAAQIEAHDAGAQAQGRPTAIRKMGLDSGAKFLHEYCAFDPDSPASSPAQAALAARGARGLLTPDEERLLGANSSAALPFRAPLAPHLESRPAPRHRRRESGGGGGGGGGDDDDDLAGWHLLRRAAADALARLERRGFSCPSGTSDCSSIGYPYSCCQTGLACVEIEDTGLGPVGCCPSGTSCSGAIQCSDGQLGCPSNMGGGCCIDGYVCEGVGCVRSQSSESVMTSTLTSTATASGSPSLVVVTVTITQTPPESVATSTTTRVVTASPASSSSTTGPGAPVRATGSTTVTPASSSSSAQPGGYCPTGYYACLASAAGGCCQTGRDCSTTSCPPVSSTTVVSDGVTVVVPATGVPASSSTGSCAGGWYLCPAQAGPVAGCCPSGYGCGTASCTLSTASATATVQKEPPGSSGGARTAGGRGGWMVLAAAAPAVLAFMAGFAQIQT